MSNFSSDNLIPAPASPVAGQRVLQVAPGIWIPVGMGGAYPPQAPSDSSSQELSICAGYIDINGNFQPLKFDGTQASDSGSAVEGLSVGIFNTGHPEPDYPSGGGSMDFYKCTAVFEPQTWNGKKAVLNEGVYSFESDSTSGLTYTTVVPQVGNIYADGALIQAKLYEGIPISGLVFYAPLNAVTSTAQTGQILSIQGTTPIASTVDGVPCLGFSTNGYIYTTDSTGIPTGKDPWTASIWIYNTAKRQDNSSAAALLFGQLGYDIELDVYVNGNKLRVGNWNTMSIETTLSDVDLMNKWIHMLAINNGSSTILYINGVQKGSANSWQLQAGNINVGGMEWQDTIYGQIGYLASVRIYNRALTSAEIQALASQFTPTT